MNRKFSEWYTNLSNANQLGVSFVLYLVFGFTLSFLLNLLVWHKDRPVEYFALGAIFPAIVLTVVANWFKVKGLFKQNKA